MRFPIKYKLAGIILIIFLPLIGVSIHYYFEILKHDKEDIKTRNRETAVSLAAILDEKIKESFVVLDTLSSHPAVITKNSRDSDGLFSKLVKMHPDYLNIVAADMDGYNTGSGVYSPDIRKLNHKDLPWFQRASNGAPVVDDLHISKLSKAPTVMISMPVRDGRKDQIGVLGIALNLSTLANNLATTWALPARSTVMIVDSKNNVIADTLNGEAIGRNIGEIPVLKKALQESKGSVEDTGADGIRRLYGFSRMASANWRVLVGIPTEEVYRHAHLFSNHYISILFVIALAALALAVVLTRKMTSKVSLLSKGMKEIERGNLNVRLTSSGNDELDDLARSFNRMTENRYTAEKEMRESKTFLSTVLDGMGEGLAVIDRDFRIVSANQEYCRQVKMPCESVIGCHCYKISHHIDEPCYLREDGCDCCVTQCFATGTHHRALHTHYDKDLKPIYIETNAYPVRDESGNVVLAIEAMMDVTDKVTLEKRLEEIKERYRKLYDDAPDMMHSVNKDGMIIICNRTEAAALGYGFDEIIGQPFTKIIAPEERDHCLQKFEAIKKQGSFEGEATLTAKDGRRIPTYMKVKAIYDANGNFLMTDAILRDISEKKSLEVQLLHAQKMEAVGKLSGGIAHDFNNILTAVIGYGNLLQMQLGEDDPLRNHVDHILSAAERAAQLTRSLLAFSTKQIISPRKASVNEIITRLDGILQRIIGEDIELKAYLSPQEVSVFVDVGQIEQVLMNLCTNARDAMPGGGTLVIETELVAFDVEYIRKHAFARPGRYMVIAVTDTGDGIDEMIKEKIFEPFFTTKEIGAGTGLGLSIVYGIIRQHEGYINVYSERGKGTTFKIYLPVVEQDAEVPPESGALALDSIPVITTGNETILLTEDEASLREYAQNVLEEHGYKVITADDGEDAVRKFMTYRDSIDLLIFDVIMPRKNGKEAYDEIREQRPGIKAIFMSGYTANIIHKQGILKPGIELITKPFPPSSLLRKVRQVLDKETNKASGTS